MFGRAAIRLGIGPHSSFVKDYTTVIVYTFKRVQARIPNDHVRIIVVYTHRSRGGRNRQIDPPLINLGITRFLAELRAEIIRNFSRERHALKI